VSEQADHEDHCDTWQSTGQWCVLHACDATKAGQAEPPWAEATETARVRVCRPPPHCAEQTDHLDQPDTTQLTGHAAVPQTCCRDKVGHALPPYAAGVMTARVCDCTPPPHDCEQADHDDHDVTSQCTGQ